MDPKLDGSIFDNFEIQSAEMVDFKEKCDQQVQWAELPSIPLERIYSFLRREDQIDMSLVCRSWSEGFNSPSVWKTFRFSLTESQLLMDSCPVIKCAEKYSRMFRHVEIVCIRNVDEHLIETWFRRLIVFLDILTRNSQLISLKVRWPEIYFILDTIICAEDVKKAMTNFWISQHHWKRVEFYSHYFIFLVVEDLKEFPMRIVLRRFVNNIEHMDQEGLAVAQGLHTLLCQKCQIFQGSPFFHSDYSFIHKRMSASQSAVIDKLRKRQASKIIFQCYGSIQSNYRGLTADTWRFLKQSWSDIQVELYFETESQSRQEVEFFFEPEMPITQLDYSFTVCKSEHSSIMEIDALFNHLLICKINEHLVSLRLAWILPIPDLASTCIPFLQACTKLKRLQIFIVYPANGVDLLANSWLENRPKSLEKVFIDISGVGNEDNYTSLMYFVTEYMTLLGTVGLNLEVKLNIGQTIFG